MDSLIYQNLKIDLHNVPAGLIKEYLQVRYWLNMASKPSFANLCRYKMAAQHLSNAGDFARLQQLCVEVPELKNLVFISEPVENNEPTETAQARCRDCIFYSGDSGNKLHHIMCAVAVPQPTLAAVRKARGSLPNAWHNCKHFKTDTRNISAK
jgi:hypothetical protein